MQLTRQSQIAIAILTACARDPGGYLHTSVASEGMGVSKEYAAKVAHLLLRAGFIRSARGRHGGIGLTRPAEEISLAAVLRHTQPELSDAAPRPHVEGAAADALNTVIETGWAGFVELMDRFTIADLLANRAPQRPVCHNCDVGEPKHASSGSMTTCNERAESYARALHG